MDELKALKKYIKPAAWLCAASALLFVLAAASLYIGVTQSKRDYIDEALRFDPVYSDSKSYGYVDICGVSDWVYKYDYEIYYAAEDADGYLYTVRLYQGQHDEMTAQRAYWARESDDAKAPEPYRVYGLVRGTGSSLRESFSEAFGISEEDYGLYFGTLYLDATATPGGEAAWIWYIAALFSFLFSMLFLILILPHNRNMKKCLKRLARQDALEDAAYAFNSPACEMMPGDKVRLNGNYLFGRGTGIAVRMDEILWAYTRAVNYSTYSLVICTAKMKNVEAIFFGAGSPGGTNETVLSRIAGKNPKALIGYTNENKQKYKELCNTTGGK